VTIRPPSLEKTPKDTPTTSSDPPSSFLLPQAETNSEETGAAPDRNTTIGRDDKMKHACSADLQGVATTMTTLTLPTFEQRLLQTVMDEAVAEPVHEWPQRSLQLCLDIFRKMRENAATMRPMLEQELAEGVKARSFARTHGPLLLDTDNFLASIRQLLARLLLGVDAASASLVSELRLLEQETQGYRNLLTEAMSPASAPPSPRDRERVRAAEEARARGETRCFSR
jgi:hypothetical protein